MSKQPPDFSFERDERPLSDWLRKLVATEAPTRLAAGDALQAMFYGVPSVHTNLNEIDWAASARMAADHGDRFKATVRMAVEEPGFPTSEFVSRLIAYRMTLRKDWGRRAEEMSAVRHAPSKYEERLKQRIEAAENEDEREEAMSRFMRWVCADRTGCQALGGHFLGSGIAEARGDHGFHRL